jgi:hypothetical protein
MHSKIQLQKNQPDFVLDLGYHLEFCCWSDDDDDDDGDDGDDGDDVLIIPGICAKAKWLDDISKKNNTWR